MKNIKPTNINQRNLKATLVTFSGKILNVRSVDRNTVKALFHFGKHKVLS